MVVTCSASAISRSVSVAKFAAAVVMNALISSGCAFEYPSPAVMSITFIATFKACSVISSALYLGAVLSLRFLSDLLNLPDVCIFIFTLVFKKF